MTEIAIRDVTVPMRDGIGLATDVVVADDARAKPALLLRGPYSRAEARQGSDPVHLARQGWAVVVQDSRGRFDSEGRFEPFRHEGPDGADTVAWIAEQPWCDGRVVGWGGSYLGFASWLTARERPAGLVAICPTMAGGSVRRGLVHEGGAFQLGMVASWLLGLALMDPALPEDRRERAIELSLDRDRLLRTPLAAHPLRELVPAFDRWLDGGDGTEWAATDVFDDLHRIDVPALQVAGWYDVHCEDALALYTGMRRRGGSERARDQQRLVVGPWTHTTMFLPMAPHYDFGAAASGVTQGFPGELLQWAGRIVDAKQVESGVTVFVIGAGEWVDLPAWPPPATPLRLHLASRRGANGLTGDGVLTPQPRSGRDRFRYDPHHPVPTRGGRLMWPLRPMAGPVDQRPVEERADVLVYTSEPLDDDLTVVGPVAATVAFETTGRSADVTVKLVDVWPDERAFNVVDSIRRVDVTPDQPRNVAVAVGSTAVCFRAGHRIRVEISSSNFPRFDRNPSTGMPSAEATVLEGAWQTVHHDGSWIDLPVTDGVVP